jgi:hypothetical protein
MKRLTTFTKLLLFLIIAITSQTGCNRGIIIQNIDWVDFIKFNGISYLRTVQPLPYHEEDLEYFGVIQFRVDGNVNTSGYQIKDGDAAFLDKGIRIYSINSYSTDFRLLAKVGTEFYLYETDTNPDAKNGSDLLDIGGKVNYVSINSSIDGTTELASIRDKIQVNQLIQMVLDAPVDQIQHRTGSEQYFLEFNFIDGTVTIRSYWLDTGILARGMQLPEEFGQIIRMALSQSVAVALD